MFVLHHSSTMFVIRLAHPSHAIACRSHIHGGVPMTNVLQPLTLSRVIAVATTSRSLNWCVALSPIGDELCAMSIRVTPMPRVSAWLLIDGNYERAHSMDAIASLDAVAARSCAGRRSMFRAACGRTTRQARRSAPPSGMSISTQVDLPAPAARLNVP
jgi:hypothetical protein